jgi:hypothetical protein
MARPLSWQVRAALLYFAIEISIVSSRLCGAASSLSTGLVIDVSSEAVAVCVAVSSALWNLTLTILLTPCRVDWPPYLYGLAVNGADGVAKIVNILREEFQMAMALTGRPDIRSIDRTVLWK